MRNKFDMQLESLSVMLIEMGKLCEKAIANVTEALRTGKLDLAKLVIEEDTEIDHMEKEIEGLCLKLLLQQQPVARDLRQISAALKLITDMERIGDQTADIAEIMISAGMSEGKDIQELSEMAAIASQMVHDSVKAYVEHDLAMARLVMGTDDQVDQLFLTVTDRLVRLIANQQGQHGEQVIDILMITKYLERIGDHATNIAEWVEFSITGVHKA